MTPSAPVFSHSPGSSKEGPARVQLLLSIAQSCIVASMKWESLFEVATVEIRVVYSQTIAITLISHVCRGLWDPMPSSCYGGRAGRIAMSQGTYSSTRGASSQACDEQSPLCRFDQPHKQKDSPPGMWAYLKVHG